MSEGDCSEDVSSDDEGDDSGCEGDYSDGVMIVV